MTLVGSRTVDSSEEVVVVAVGMVEVVVVEEVVGVGVGEEEMCKVDELTVSFSSTDPPATALFTDPSAALLTDPVPVLTVLESFS